MIANFNRTVLKKYREFGAENGTKINLVSSTFCFFLCNFIASVISKNERSTKQNVEIFAIRTNVDLPKIVDKILKIQNLVIRHLESLFSLWVDVLSKSELHTRLPHCVIPIPLDTLSETVSWRAYAWLWFEQKTFVFRAILKKLGLIEQPSLTNSQINWYKGIVQYPELQEAKNCFCDRKQAQRKGGTL